MPQPWELSFEEPSDTSTEAPPWTQEFEAPVLDSHQMALASREIPLPGYTTPQADTFKTMAENRVLSAPSEQALAAGRFQRERAEAPFIPPESILGIPQGLPEKPPPVETTLGVPQGMTLSPVERPPSTYDRYIEAQKQSLRQLGSGVAEDIYKSGRAIAGAPVEEEAPSDSLKIVRGLGAGAGDVIAGFTEPQNLPLLLAGQLPGALGKAATTLFMADMAASAPELYSTVKEALQSGDKEKEAEALFQALSTGTFFTLMGLHLKAKAPRETVTEFMDRYTPEQRAAFYERLKPEWSKQLREKAIPESEVTDAIQRETETAVRPVRESPGESVSEVPVEKPGTEDVARGEPQATEEKLPEVQRDVGPSFDEMAKKVDQPEPFLTSDYKGEHTLVNGLTGFAYDLGLKAKTPEDVQALKDLREKWRAEFQKARTAKDFDAMNQAALRSQVANEAHEAATGANVEGIPKEVLKRSIPNFKPKFPHENWTKMVSGTGREAALKAAYERLNQAMQQVDAAPSEVRAAEAEIDKLLKEQQGSAATEAQQRISQEKERAPAYTLGIAAPGTAQAQQLIRSFGTAVKESPSWIRDVWNSFSLKSAPKMTESKRELGESAVRYAASPLVGRTKGQIFADRVLAGTNVDPVKFGTAITEDNLRAVRRQLQNELADVSDPEVPEKVDPIKGAKLQEQLAKSATLIGTQGSPFKTEAEYQAFLADPQTRKALSRHRQMWAEQKDPLFRQATDLDPNTPLQTRGDQTGARINLKAVNPEEPGVAPIGRPGFKQLATLRRRDPFAAKATGAGQAYEGHYHEIMAHGFERELPVAAQHQFIKELIDNGDAVVKDKSFIEDLELKGENTKGYLLTLKPWTGKFLHVRNGLIPEYEGISNLRQPIKVPILSAANNFLTRQSIAGLAEGTTHSSNLMTTVFTAPGPTVNPMLNAVIKSLGRVDLLYSIPKIIIKGFSNQRERMLELTEIGAAKEPYTGAISKRLLNPIDQGVRIVLDDIYKGMAEKGIVEKSETARREFINQTGQYNKRLQPNLTRILRETLNPFQTATQTFVAQGLRRMALGPGVKATNNARALSLKADVAAGWMGAIALIAVLNKVTSGKVAGPAGTPLGAVGWVDDKGKVRSFNVLRLLGYERGLRATGVGPAIEARMRGLSGQQAALAGGQSVVSTGLGMVMGPGARFATIAGTGLRPTQPWVKEAKTVPPSDSFNPIKTQMAENIKTAVVEANPIISTAAEIRKGVKEGQRPTDIALKVAEKQASRYAPRTGMSERMAKALPKIVDSRQLRDYTEDVAKDARKLPLNQRYRYVRTRFNEDGLGIKYRDNAWRQIEERGTLKYK